MSLRYLTLAPLWCWMFGHGPVVTRKWRRMLSNNGRPIKTWECERCGKVLREKR